MNALKNLVYSRIPLEMVRRVVASDRGREHFKPLIREMFFSELLTKTQNFGDVTWCGRPIWQNVLDLWTIQETIAALKPELLIECGTNRGGSAFFYAQLFDLLGCGRVITIDIKKLHNLDHPRVSALTGSSVDESILQQVRTAASTVTGPIMVILDSDHTAAHVARELELYHQFVTPGSFLLVQDGMIDTLPDFQEGRPGPLAATVAFLKDHPEFEVDQKLCDRFLITHHPMGWLRRR